MSVFAATALTFAVEPLFAGKAPLFFFTLAVIVSAVYGLGPGLLATALSVGTVSLFFREILALVLIHSNLVLFAVVGIGISFVMGRLQKANSALVEAQRALRSANEQLVKREEFLSQSNEELRRFAYTVAHDLSTPVRTISALTELLVLRNAARLDESSKECADLIVGKAIRLQEMIRGLLDYAVAVDTSAETVTGDAGVSVQEAIQDLDTSIASHAAEITVDRLPTVAMAQRQLVQVFSNLISNSIKYSHVGRRPRIHISATEQSEDYLFCVSDNGIGLDMQYAEEVFGIFKRLHGDRYEGTGIGLALCKAVIESHGGRIWLESEVGEGTKFYFTIAKARSNPQPAVDVPSPTPAATLRAQV